MSPGGRGGLLANLTGGGSVTSSYWDTIVSGLSTSAGGTGRTTTELQNPATLATIYVGWDFTTIWLPPSTGTHPRLR